MPLRFSDVQHQRRYRMGAGDYRSTNLLVRHSRDGCAQLIANFIHAAEVETNLGWKTGY
jgi:hypothetical protein